MLSVAVVEVEQQVLLVRELGAPSVVVLEEEQQQVLFVRELGVSKKLLLLQELGWWALLVSGSKLSLR